jgi:tripartite-type tricarboxylate transporter receptor subunit TctC
LPSGVPAERVTTWRNAFQQVLKDEQFLEDARKVGLEINARSGEDVQKLVEDLYRTPPADIVRARAVFGYNSANR